MTTLPDWNPADYDHADWAGEGGEAITPATTALAEVVFDLLQKPPHVAPGGDGTIGFEWMNTDAGTHMMLDVKDGHVSVRVRNKEKDRPPGEGSGPSPISTGGRCADDRFTSPASAPTS